MTWNQVYEAMEEAVGADLQTVYLPSDFVSDVADSVVMGWMPGNLFVDKANSVIFDNIKIKIFFPHKVALPL